MKALIFIAHGSKKELSNSEFKDLVQTIKEEDKNYDFIEASFLEIASPSIEICVDEVVKKGAKEIIFYPFFLNSGKHILVDIPNIIEELKKNYPEIFFSSFEHFGKSKYIKEIILRDISN